MGSFLWPTACLPYPGTALGARVRVSNNPNGSLRSARQRYDSAFNTHAALVSVLYSRYH